MANGFGFGKQALENSSYVKELFQSDERLMTWITSNSEPLHLAIQYGNLDLTQFFAEVEAKTEEGEEKVKMINAAREVTHFSPLHTAIIVRRPSVIKFFLDHPETDLEQKNIWGDNLFHVVSLGGSIKEQGPRKRVSGRQEAEKKTDRWEVLKLLFQLKYFLRTFDLLDASNNYNETVLDFAERDNIQNKQQFIQLLRRKIKLASQLKELPKDRLKALQFEVSSEDRVEVLLLRALSENDAESLFLRALFEDEVKPLLLKKLSEDEVESLLLKKLSKNEVKSLLLERLRAKAAKARAKAIKARAEAAKARTKADKAEEEKSLLLEEVFEAEMESVLLEIRSITHAAPESEAKMRSLLLERLSKEEKESLLLEKLSQDEAEALLLKKLSKGKMGSLFNELPEGKEEFSESGEDREMDSPSPCVPALFIQLGP